MGNCKNVMENCESVMGFFRSVMQEEGPGVKIGNLFCCFFGLGEGGALSAIFGHVWSGRSLLEARNFLALATRGRLLEKIN